MTAVDTRPSAIGSVAAPTRTVAQTVRAYVALTKPRIIELLLVSTVPTMFLAAHGLPSLSLVLTTLVGGTLAAGSANSLNCYVDRDIDVLMNRTGRRPLATRTVSPREAMVFGITLGVIAVAMMAALVNVLAAVLTLTAILFYVLVYTVGLKRRTPSNIVWGGAAGCMPVLIGWAAVRDGLGWTPLVLFLVIFFWTPPHYWPLAMRFRDDYATAKVPMLPVVASDRVVTRRVVVYAWLMVAASVAVWPVAGTTPVYGVAAIVLGAGFLLEAHRLDRRAGAGRTGSALGAMRLFHGSITYLTLLFLALAIDPLLH